MRTTLQLDDDLMRQAEKLGVDSGRTLTSVVEDALREMLARREEARRQGPAKFTTYGERGLRPGVDLDDSAGLLKLMEGNEWFHPPVTTRDFQGSGGGRRWGELLIFRTYHSKELADLHALSTLTQTSSASPQAREKRESNADRGKRARRLVDE